VEKENPVVIIESPDIVEKITEKQENIIEKIIEKNKMIKYYN